MKRLICGLIGHDWRWAPMRRYYSVNLEGTDWVSIGVAQVARCNRCHLGQTQRYTHLGGDYYVGVPGTTEVLADG